VRTGRIFGVNIYHLSPLAASDPPVQHHDVAQDAALLERVPGNIVQSIRAFRIPALQQEAERLGQHFLYAHCANALTRQQVLAYIADAFHVPRFLCKTVEGLHSCLTKQLFQAGPQTGFVVVLDQLPNTPRFDREARETLLDVFRDAADFWAVKQVPFRVFYSFS
jgi:hypothetical protein